jgi:hypothetical protein
VIHVHTDNHEVAISDHFHRQSDAVERTDRTWVLRCTPGCEDRILRDVEHSATHAGGVPLTVAEMAIAEAASEASQRDVSRLATALNALAVEPAGGR